MNNPEALPLDIAEQQRWLGEHKADTGLPWTKLAPKIGVPSGTLSQFPTGNYKGDNKRIADAVFRYRQLLLSQAEITVEMPAAPSFFETPTARKIANVLAIAQRGRMVVLSGAPGTSKTSTARHYQASMANVKLITIRPSTKNIATMPLAVLIALGADKVKGTTQALSLEIVRRLREMPGGLLIFDEAHYLGDESLEEIRAWHDETGIGVAFIGNEDVLTRLTLGAKKDALSRLSSRVGQRFIFRQPSEADVAALADAWSIEAEDQRAFLGSVAGLGGGLRNCTMLIELAWMLAAADGGELRRDHLEDAWHDLSMKVAA